jgi:hypothetical protein
MGWQVYCHPGHVGPTPIFPGHCPFPCHPHGHSCIIVLVVGIVGLPRCLPPPLVVHVPMTAGCCGGGGLALLTLAVFCYCSPWCPGLHPCGHLWVAVVAHGLSLLSWLSWLWLWLLALPPSSLSPMVAVLWFPFARPLSGLFVSCHHSPIIVPPSLSHHGCGHAPLH